jgi:hypothetical protein
MEGVPRDGADEWRGPAWVAGKDVSRAARSSSVQFRLLPYPSSINLRLSVAG